MFAALRHPPFRLLWTSTLLWSIPRWMEIVVLGWLVLELTNSPFLVGMVTAARGFPFLLFGALGGVAADRTPSRPRLLAAAQTATLGLTLLLAFLIGTGLVQVWHLMAVAFLSGTVLAFDQPTRQTLVYDLVGEEDLMNGLALNSSAWNLARILGPAAGGVLLGWIGPGLSFLLMAAGHAVALGCTLSIKTPARAAAVLGGSIWHNLKEGLSYVFASPLPRSVLLLEIVTDILALPYIFVLLPVFARDVLAVGATGLGFMTAAAGLGALGGALGVALLGERLQKGRALLLAACLYGLFLLLFSASPWYPLSLALLALTGAFTSVQVTLVNTLLQTTVPQDMRGRMMGVYVLTWGFMPVGSLQAGAVATVLGAPVAGAAGGLALVIFSLVLARVAPALRRA